MKLSELYQKLSYGELQNLTMSNDGDGTIKDEAKPKLVNYINEALLRLYSRFLLAEDDLMLIQQEYITLYYLVPKFAVNYNPSGKTDDEPIRFIFDLPEDKFEDEVIKILAVTNLNGGDIPLNDETNCISLFTPQAKILQIPHPLQDVPMSVRYQKKHTKILVNLDQEIELPDVLDEALSSYIGYKVFSHMNSAESNAKAQEFLGLYEAVCTQVMERDLVGTSISQTNTRFSRGGWI